jgi:hypothetical protein
LESGKVRFFFDSASAFAEFSGLRAGDGFRVLMVALMVCESETTRLCPARKKGFRVRAGDRVLLAAGRGCFENSRPARAIRRAGSPNND